MAHMFENCSSLISVNLSNFTFDITENIENMFANDNNLVYVNLINAEDSKIKQMNNMFLGTLENMVFCNDESISSRINRIIENKGCSVIDCSDDWIKSRKLIIASSNECVEKCPDEFKFQYDYKCYYRCPGETVPENFICIEPTGQKNITYIEDNNKTCSVKKYFLGDCKRILSNYLLKKKFIEETVNDMINGKLYELALRTIEKKEIFIIDDITEVYSIYSISNKNRNPNLIDINMEECISILKSIYKYINNDIIIFQVEYKIPEFKIPIVEYALFTLYGAKKLPLSHCPKTKVSYDIPKIIPDFQEYKYNPNNIYYYDKCLPYSNENNIDLTLQDRKFYFNMNNMSLCETGCVYIKYIHNYIKCECDIKIKFNSFLNPFVNKSNAIYRFDIEKEASTNFWVLHCFFNIFDKEVILSNLISQIILGTILLSFIGSIVFYFVENKILYNNIKIFIMSFYSKKKTKQQINNNKTDNKKNPPKRNSIIKKRNSVQVYKHNRLKSRFSFLNKNGSSSISQFLKTQRKKTNIDPKTYNYNDRTYNELNNLSYYDAIIQDKRSLVQLYISYIMSKQLLLFTFHCRKDYNSKIIKIIFLLYTLIIFLLMNTVFVNDSILHDIFIHKGNIGLFYYIKRPIIITILSLIIKNLLMLFVFTENDVVSLREENETVKTEKIRKTLTIVTMKCCLFFVFNLFSLIFIWIYSACFFSIFKNTHFFVLKNTLITFGISLLIPLVFGFVSCLIRSFSLSNRESKNRICTYYLSRILQIVM